MTDEAGTQPAGPQATATETSAPELDGGGITDAELTALALAADPDRPVDGDAVPLDTYLGEPRDHLPQWYMPPVTARRGRRWRTWIVLTIVLAFLVIEAVGLCSSYGQLVVG